MYKEYTAADWRKYLELPEDYVIEGMLVYGGWNKEEHFEILQKSLTQQGIQFTIVPLPDFLNRMMEFVVDGKRYWFAVSYGGALLSEYLHLACLFGSKKNILIGTCGGLSEQMNSGDFLLPTYTFGNESTTRLYQREISDNKHLPDTTLTDSLLKRINAKFKIHQGPTMTCQAMMGETFQDIQSWSADGYYGVEMEAATIFAVSNHFKVPSAALLVVGDNLIKGEAVGGDGYENARALRHGARLEQYQIALAELFSQLP